jgi:DNA polymerase-3 subunit epsilon
MLLLGIDLETGGSFDAPLEENFITEIGMVLWDTERDTPVQMLSELIYEQREVCPEAEQYTGISTELVQKYGKSLKEVVGEVYELFDKADYIVAHNGNNFDRPIMENIFVDLKDKKMTWIDTLVDVEYPSNCVNRNLTYLQCFHGFAYPGHRAIFDIMAMFRIMGHYDLDRIIAVAESPVVKLVAKMDPPANWKNAKDVARFNAEKDKVKKAGFRWNPDNKTWTLETKQILLEHKQFDFPYTVKGERHENSKEDIEKSNQGIY